MKKLILFILLSPLFTLGQNIKGSILNSSNNLPIQDVNIALKQIDVNTTTDERGLFTLKLSTKLEESDSLYVSHIGYTPKKISFYD